MGRVGFREDRGRFACGQADRKGGDVGADWWVGRSGERLLPFTLRSKVQCDEVAVKLGQGCWRREDVKRQSWRVRLQQKASACS